MSTYSVRLLEFSLARAGIFYRLQERLNLVNKNDQRVLVRAGIFAFVSWLPLVLLAAAEQLFRSEPILNPLLLDFTIYGRFLLAVPILVTAENLLDDRYVTIASYFSNSGVVPDEEKGDYVRLLSSVQRLANARLPEIVFLLLAYALSLVSITSDLFRGPLPWTHTPTGSLTLPGWWVMLVSVPLFQFLVYRWVWRYMIWYYFLWKLLKLRLLLIPTHPDSAAGLGILSESIYGFVPFLFALSIVLSSFWCRRAMFEGAGLSEFYQPFLMFFALSVLIPVIPLFVVTGTLIKLKVRGLHDYGVLANSHSLQFDEKWIRDPGSHGEPLLGTPDISSLCDLSTDYKTVQGMTLIPCQLQNLMVLAASVCIPMVPLILTHIPLKDLVLKISQALL